MIRLTTTLSYGVPVKEGKRRVSLVVRYSTIFHIQCNHERLFQTLYRRRKRDANCVVGKDTKIEHEVVSNCACGRDDFEW